MEKLLIIAFVLLILWNLGAGLYYMMVDKGKTDRTVKSLSWRIGLSVLLILLVIVGIFTGVIKPHGIYGSTFFMLTGFHGMHVMLGTIMLAVMWLRCAKGHFSKDHHFAFEAVAWYWHFVDVVWLGLYIVVYWF